MFFVPADTFKHDHDCNQDVLVFKPGTVYKDEQYDNPPPKKWGQIILIAPWWVAAV